MKKLVFLLMISVLPLAVFSQRIRIEQIRSTGESVGRIITTDGSGSFQFGDVPSNIPFLSDKSISLTADLSDYFPTDATRQYSMIPRIAINPVNGIITMVFHLGYDHVGNHDNGIVIRRSLDYGKTWEYIGGAGISYVINNAGSDDRNAAIFYTPSGRLMLMYGVYISGVWQKSKYRYSDDDGVTWSADTEITHGLVGENVSTQPYSNRCFVAANGDLYYPWYSFATTPSYYTSIHLARSTDDGVTWNFTYKTIFDGATNLGVVTEPVAVDLGDGNWSVVCRTGKANAAGDIVPIILISNDEGVNWGGGTWDTIGADKNSDFMYLNGDGVTLAQSTSSLDQTLPDACVINIGNEPFLVINYWIRRDGLGNDFELRRHLLPVREVLDVGLSASLRHINQLVHESPYEFHNGGNGSSIALDGSILHVSVEQITSATSGGQSQIISFIYSEEDLLQQFIGIKKAQTITYSTTPTHDWNTSPTGVITLTGNVTTYVLSNIPDNETGGIIIIQNGTGGYGITDIAHSGLSINYVDGLKPTAANINTVANGHTVLNYWRVGSSLYVTFGKFGAGL